MLLSRRTISAVAVALALACTACSDSGTAPSGGGPGGPAVAPTGTGGTTAAPPSGGQPVNPTSPLPAPPAGTPPGPPDPGVTPPVPEGKALEALRAYLAQPAGSRPPIAEQLFSSSPLSMMDAQVAGKLLWDDLRVRIEPERRAELTAKTVTAAGKTMKYDTRVFGTAPANGRSFFISMHGGGMAPASVNDGQWRNQITLYKPSEGVYLAPRAPTDNWNLWHEPHIDPLFDRLIANFVAFEGVDPDRVYIMGYSAGGDGVHQLAPRMADRLAAAAMMAGHPNDASPRPVRNIGYTLHVGALDGAFMRNQKLTEWGTLLDGLQAADPMGYVHDVQLHAGKPHWMDLEDAVAVPWMQKFTRKPLADKVVWVQDDVTQTRFYWLAVEPAAAVKKNTLVVSREGANFRVEEATGVTRFALRLVDEMTNLDATITITRDGKTVATPKPIRTIATLAKTLAERETSSGMFSAEVWVDLQ